MDRGNGTGFGIGRLWFGLTIAAMVLALYWLYLVQRQDVLLEGQIMEMAEHSEPQYVGTKKVKSRVVAFGSDPCLVGVAVCADDECKETLPVHLMHLDIIQQLRNKEVDHLEVWSRTLPPSFPWYNEITYYFDSSSPEMHKLRECSKP